MHLFTLKAHTGKSVQLVEQAKDAPCCLLSCILLIVASNVLGCLCCLVALTAALIQHAGKIAASKADLTRCNCSGHQVAEICRLQLALLCSVTVLMRNVYADLC